MSKPTAFILTSTLISWLLVAALAAVLIVPLKIYPAFFTLFLLALTISNMLFLKRAKKQGLDSKDAGKFYFALLIASYVLSSAMGNTLVMRVSVAGNPLKNVLFMMTMGSFLWPMMAQGYKLLVWFPAAACLFLAGPFLSERAYKIWLGIAIGIIAFLVGPLIVPIWWGKILILLGSILIGLLMFYTSRLYLKLGKRGTYARTNLNMWIAGITITVLIVSYHFGFTPSGRIVNQRGVKAIERFDKGGQLARLMYGAKKYISWYSCDGNSVFASISVKLLQAKKNSTHRRNIHYRPLVAHRWRPLPSVHRHFRPPVNCPQGVTLVERARLITFNPPEWLSETRLPDDIPYGLSTYKILLPKGSEFPILLELHAVYDKVKDKFRLRTIAIINRKSWDWVSDPESISVACPVENGKELLILNGKSKVATHKKLTEENNYTFVEQASLDEELAKVDEKNAKGRITAERDSCWCLKEYGCYYHSSLANTLYHWQLNPISTKNALKLPVGRCWVYPHEDYKVVFLVCETQGTIFALRANDLKYLGAVYVGELARGMHFNPKDPNRAVVLSKAGLFEIDLTEAFNLPDGTAGPNDRPGYLRLSDKIFLGGWF